MYVATINIPGYLPQDDDPPTFEDARSAWEYLANERERDEDNYEEWPLIDPSDPESSGTTEYTETVATLRDLADESTDYATAEVQKDYGVDSDGTGSVNGPTPGYDGDHDLGLDYTVSLVEVTDEMFDAKLMEILRRLNVEDILAVPWVYELLSEEYNNAVLSEIATDGAACPEHTDPTGDPIHAQHHSAEDHVGPKPCRCTERDD
jgi:hypothetical protein